MKQIPFLPTRLPAILQTSAPTLPRQDGIPAKAAKRQRLLLPLFLTFIILLVSIPGMLDAKTWIGGTGNWDVGSNWSPAGIPTSSDDVTISSGSVTIPDGVTAAAKSVLITGGTLTIEPNASLTTYASTAQGIFLNGNVSGSSMTLINHGDITITKSVGSSYGDAIRNLEGTIENYGTITIPALASIARHGIYNLSNSFFTNKPGGIISIQKCPNGNGINGSFINEGIVNIGTDASANIGDYCINASFTNTGTTTLGKADVTLTNGTFTNNTNGILKGTGTISATGFADNGGTLSPGYSSPGTQTFNADEDFSNSTLEMEINGTGTAGVDFDQIVVNGTATLDGGILSVTINYSPSSGDEITILNATSIPNLEEFVIDPLVPLPPNWSVIYDYPNGDVILQYCSNITFVDGSATGLNNGTSWANAFTDLQDALAFVSIGDCPAVTEIWVAAGTYKPTTGTDRTISFVMKNDLAIYGGFNGTETLLSQRDWTANVCTLSGNIGLPGIFDNTYNVIFNYNNGLNNTAVLDGFTISGGYAYGSPPHNFGGGMRNESSSPTVANCTFSGNRASNFGGGMSNYSSSPTVTNCSFNGNFANNAGGGMFNTASSPFLVVSNCSFSGNWTNNYGGGMANDNSASPVVTNCSFSGNKAYSSGGGMDNFASASPTVTNCSFSGNEASSDGGGMYNRSSSSPTVTNCVLWGNSSGIENSSSTPTVTYSIVQGGYTGAGNLDVDPLFADQPPVGLGTSGDLHLTPCSPAKNVGTSTGAPATDFDGDARPLETGIDMGFDENGIWCCPAGNITYVDGSATGNNNGSSWTHAFTDLQDALAFVNNGNCPAVTEIWVAAGTYTPTTCTTCTNADRQISFVMKNDLAIYGGFDGTEALLSERDWTANVTTLSGDIDQNDNPNDPFANNGNNSYHVIFNDFTSGNLLTSTAKLDGFTITGGNANGTNTHENLGGGMYNIYSSPTLTNCSFSNNYGVNGGGMRNTSSSPTITNCSFSGNAATGGGGMRNAAATNPNLTNCTFSGNSAAGVAGGMGNLSSSPTLTNCSFSGNSADDFGGAMTNYTLSDAILTNCSFSGNTAPNYSGAGIVNSTSSPTLTNCILWGNGSEIYNTSGTSTPTVTYSIVQGGYTGTGNLDVDPLFVSATDLHLTPCSPAKNVGATQAQAPAGVTIPATDFDGDARPLGAGFDMGFDENGETCCPVGNVLYVDGDATGLNLGNSWANAFTDLQDALALVNSGDCPAVTEIWVAAGTYTPTTCTTCTTADRQISFVMKNGLAIYGGFDGTEALLSERDWTANVCTLSGDIGTPGNNTDNSYHVIYNDGLGSSSTAVLDGFTISGGNANGASPHDSGGGMYNGNSDPNVTNCTFSGNSAFSYGGGMYNSSSFPTVSNCSFSGNSAGNGGGMFNTSSSPAVTNCSFSANSASNYGGGMYNLSNSSPAVANCSFSGNSATNFGGGMYNSSSSSPLFSLTNCVFSGNSASFGGGMYNSSSSPTVTNCSFSGNLASSIGGVMRNNSSSPTLTNCILWGNSSGIEDVGSGTPTVTYSIVQGGYPGTGNLSVDPLFADQPPVGLGTSGDLHLTPCSPAKNVGTSTGAPTTDFDGDARPLENGMDMGFDENGTWCCPSGNIAYVDEGATGSNNGTSWANAFTSLQDALALVSSGDCPAVNEIWVAAGTYRPTTGTDQTVSFAMKNGLAIYGGFNGTETLLSERDWVANVCTLSGDIGTPGNNTDNSYHVIYNNGLGSSSTAVLDGFTISGGNANGANPHNLGGGMRNYASSPALANCTFSGNAALYGGGMYNSSSSPALTNCTFSGNSASSYGGGMYNITNSSPTVTNCTFSGNSATNGGGMYNITNSSPTVTNCTFSGNSATNGGGMYNSSSSPTIDNCTFSGNSVSYGGGMYNLSSSPTVTNCTFSGNLVSTYGGGMYNSSSSSVVTNCSFSGNSASYGGGMYISSSSSPTLTNCTFSGNSVSYGGGLYNVSSSPTVTNCTFSGNLASSIGGGMRNNSSSPTVTNCIFWGNSSGIENNGGTPTVTYSIVQGGCPAGATCTNVLNEDPLFVDEPPVGLGTSGDLHLTTCSPAKNVGTATGAPATDFDGDARPLESGIDMGFDENGTWCCPAGNIAYVDEGATGSKNGASWANAFTDLQDALALATSGDCPAITEIWVAAGTYYPTTSTDRTISFVMKNDLAIYGGFNGTETLLSERDWVANVCTLSGDIGTPGDNSDNSYHVVFNEGNILDGTAVLDGFTISGGNANGAYPHNNGGGMQNRVSDPTVTNCTFSGNSASSYGGGMNNDNSDPAVTNCSFSGNSAAYGGGGVFSSSAVTNCTFSGNSAAYNGGGMFNFPSSSLTVTNCTFSGNSASSEGGGMYNSPYSSPTVTNCSFSGNSADSGGGMLNRSSSPTVANCTFSGNSAFSGGGMNNFLSSSPAVTNCSFSGNSAAYSGGGMNNYSSSPTITKCSFSGNSAGKGGGMYNDNSASQVVTNCSFSGNSAAFIGGGMYNLYSDPTVTNCSFSGNSAANSGGGMNNEYSSPTVTNCILWGNSSGIENASGAPTVTYSIVQGGYTGTGNLDVDPLFVDQPPIALGTSGDLHLQLCSPAKNVGTATGAPATDFDGDARPLGTGFDMGFDEGPVILFVDEDAIGSNNGTSWANAFNDLQDALAFVNNMNCPAVSEIWVAAGTYRPTTGTDRAISFVMQNGVAIYGGFNGTEALLSERDWTANVTTLSGDIGAPGVNTDNSYHVIYNNGLGSPSTAVLDGFTISGGNADGPNPHNIGGGMFNTSSSPAVTNCSFSANSASSGGGGMYNLSNSSPTVTNCSFSGNSASSGGGMCNGDVSPAVTNCSFSGNSASSRGGGMYNDNSNSSFTPTVTNCSFSGNSAYYGGGMYNASSSLPVTNCTFSGNSASSRGGGMHNVNSDPTVTNCSFSGNSASSGGGMWIENSFPTLTNCILWGNSSDIDNEFSSTPTITYSILQGGIYPGTGNLSVDPLFVSQPPVGLGTSGDLHLTPCSPAKNVGTSTGAPATDFDGDARPLETGIDMGFDENGIWCCPAGNITYVDGSATGNNNGSSWAHAFTDLQDALAFVNNGNCPAVNEIWVAAGTYYPTTGTDRTVSFVMKNGLAIYGGFNGTETLRSERDWTANMCTLSGDIGTPGVDNDNSYHVINNNGLGSTAKLDGFTISGGNADGASPHHSGGGMRNSASSPTVTNCSFSGNSATNSGGGMYNRTSSDPIVANCAFSGNSAIFSGGGMFNNASSPSVTNCSFSGNSTTNYGGGMRNYSPSSPLAITNCTFSGNSAFSGGGMYNDSSLDPFLAVTNCTFSGNSAAHGGGMYNGDSSPSVTNCTFSGNSATTGGGMRNTSSSPTVTNCILWGNSSGIVGTGTPTVTYSIVQGGYTGTGNLNVDPLFVSQPPIALSTSGDLHLQACSPAKNVGATQAQAPAGVTIPTTDFDGDARPLGAGFDMGFDENGETCCPAGNALFVDGSATGLNLGNSWANAFTDLQDALAFVNSVGCPAVNEIWVAAGTYYPTTGTDRTVSFVMENGLAIYGGFDGTETLLSQRDWTANVCILSGDIGTLGDNTDNSYHVIYNNGLGSSSTAVLDGFTISGGNANAASPHNNGAGMYNSSSSPAVTNCTFSGNSASSDGGGMYNNNSSPAVTNCSFSGNSASNWGGGIQNNSSSAPPLTNCTFSGNSAVFGGGMYNFSSSPAVTNCTFSGNSASFAGGGMRNNSSSSLTVTNCILWGNSSGIESVGGTPTVTYSIVQGGFAGTGNLDVDPLFVSQPPVGLGTSGDLHLTPCSPAKNVGTATGAPATDFDGDARPLGAGFDMGFDENGETCCPAGNALFVDGSATGLNLGNSWANAFTDLQDALAFVNSGGCPAVNEIWVAAGTYYPTTGTDRTVSFVMENGLAIYGGFDGTETLLSERDWVANPTTLSGDIGTPGDNTDNSYHVIFNDYAQPDTLNSTAVLDGFTISGGNADGASPHNSGGGMYNRDADPAVANCSLSGNSASNKGGGMYNDNNSSPTVTNCSLSGNSASNNGGGMYNGTSPYPAVVANCSFSGNDAPSGGGVYNSSSSPKVANCILWGNSSEIENSNSTPTVTYSIVQGGYTGTGNLDVDPLFVIEPNYNNAPTSAGDLRLQVCSPAVDAGDNAACIDDSTPCTTISGVTTDLDGNPRFFNGGTVDMGAYELQTDLALPVTFNGNGNGNDWDDPDNWSGGKIPSYCQDVVVPSGSSVNIGTGYLAYGKSLLVDAGTLTIGATAHLDIATGVTNTNAGTLTNEGTMETGSGITNSSSATLSGNGQYTLGGDWTNSATFTTGTSTVTFNGAANSTVTSGGGAFYNVEMSKTTADLLLADGMAIDDTLHFLADSNWVQLAGNDLTLSSAGGTTGHDSTSFIVTNGTGQLVKSTLGITAFTFPVGFDALAYNPLTLVQSPTGTVDDFGVRVLENVLEDGSSGAVLTEGVADARWEVTEAVPGGSDLTLTAQWAASDELTGFDRTDSGISRHDGSGWDLTNDDAGAAAGTGPYTRTRSGVTDAGFFSVGGEKVMTYVAVAPKAFLQGAYNTGTGLMNDNLRASLLVPYETHPDPDNRTEPYTAMTGFAHVGRGGGEHIPLSVLSATGNDAVVDWVFLELRDGANSATVVQTRSALVQRDGDIVDVDGTGPVKFTGMAAGDYYLAVRHRNHLGVRTPAVRTLSRAATLHDFTTAMAQAHKPAGHPNEPMAEVATGVFAAWGGNTNSNTNVRATGPPAINDYTNLLGELGTPTNIQSNVYKAQDVNMDGTLRATGPPLINDYTKLLGILGTPTSIILQPSF